MSRFARSTLVDIVVTVIHRTDKAWKVGVRGVKGQKGVGGPDGNGIWVPKAQCEMERKQTGIQQWTMTLERSLAEEKGLI